MNVSGREQQMLKDYNQLGEDYQNLMKSKKLYVSYISKAADLGCEPAKGICRIITAKIQIEV